MKSAFTIQANVANQNWLPQFDDVQIEICLQMTGSHVKLSHRDYKNRFEPMETYFPPPFSDKEVPRSYAPFLHGEKKRNANTQITSDLHTFDVCKIVPGSHKPFFYIKGSVSNHR